MSYYLDTINIEKTTASETYSKVPGKVIELPAGSKKNRLKFELPSNDTSIQAAANVYVEVIGKGFFECSKSFILSIMSMMDLKFFKTTYKGKTIYINMNSLSNRLGIKVNKTCSKNFHLEIEKQFETIREAEKKIDAFFQELTKTRYKENGNELKTTNGDPISKTCFRKLLGLTAFSHFHAKQKQESSYLLKDGSILFLKKQENKEWPLITLFTEKVLGKGCFGKVLTVQELSMGRISVAKIAHASNQNEDVRNEDLILSKIFHNSNPAGIQQKPYSLFNFRLKDINYCGYIAPKYDTSLDNIMRQLETAEKIEAARQLLRGLKELENQKISHGDIKESNCLFRRKSDTSIECVIADFGGANDLSKQPKWAYGAPYYQLEEDYKAYQSLYEQQNSKKIKKGRAKIYADVTKLLLRRDVYAMGVTLAMLLENSRIKAENSEKLYSLVNRMLEASWKERISASEALAEFERIFPFQAVSEAI
ncbi:Protein kinase domain [Candidatus Rhabdochlamydia oedothoracis]|uniref:Protein kinase domain n=1 Tax=Candidatus Rhabdochlamydia oedothoracis TaxID=2720720 RepID=A0ABX8V0C5_9BACT|nr:MULTISPECIES: protein kinase [Rhabdochlamydia]KAG6559790.1 hypothetical protein RHOW815_000189 [Candidatus Rhabdochlamydia sp. W815]MCL6755937.1 protein kinase [Candidatus Rhabdochlamydia oedothoracis]QYF48673.1 Protein kinase domain [Candidatus Rhabdochlamydia oedothoracis]